MVNHPLVSDLLVFSGKKTENAKMAAIVADVLGYLVEGLSEIDNAPVSVLAADHQRQQFLVVN